MSFYHRIRDLREDADKTQTDIAEHLGTTAQYYGKYEKGERELPFSRAIELADFYGVSLDYIAGRTNDRAMNGDAILQDDEKRLLDQFRSLSERNKGKAELFIEQLTQSQEETGNSRKTRN